MADVSGKFFSAKKVRTGVSPSSPGVEQGEALPPVNPPGTSLNSVGLTMPSAFAVANSPLTSNGTIAVTGAGTVAQYVRGDGTLADFPESSGGGSSVSYYLNGSVSQGTIGGVAYLEMNKVPILGAGTNFTTNSNGYIASFITDAGDPNLLEIPGGNWNFESYFSASSGGGSPTFYVELYKVNSGGTATLIASNSANPELISFGTTIAPYFSSLAVPTTVLALTDRLAVRYYVTPEGRTLTLHTEGPHLCQIITTFTTGLTALNGLTSQVQFFAVGTSGTDFNIASATATHTFNLPTASASNRGALSSADWTTFNNKENAITAGTTAQYYRGDKTFQTLNTSVVPELTNLYYTEARVNANANVAANTAARHNAVTLGTANGLSLSTQQLSLQLASGSQNGALSSTDWTTFNSKENAITAGTTAQYFRGDKTFQTLNTAAVPELTNLYYTEARVNANANVAANTAARHNAVTLGTANGLSLSTQQLSLGLASAGVTGALSGTDWSTFNSKQQALNGTGFVKISGTTISYDNSTYLTTAAAASTYVPYTGATSGVDLGTYTLSASNLIANGGFNAGALLLKQSSNAQTIFLGYTAITPVGNNTLNFGFSTGSGVWKSFTLSSFLLTDNINRTYTLPDASGTIALVGGSGVGTVTSVAALTLGTSGTDLSSTVANSTTTPVITLNVPTASASNRGALSAADWTTFNNKQNALTNPVTGTGTTNYLPKFTGASTIGNSLVFDNGSSVGINTTTPSLQGFNNELTISSGTSGTRRTALNIQGSRTTASTFASIGFYHQANFVASIESSRGGADNSGNLQFFTTNAGVTGERMTITSGGNVLIGTTTDAGYKLDVNGTGRFSGALTGTSASFTSSSTLLTLTSGAGTKAVFATTRNFGVNRNFQIAVDEFAESAFTITPSTTLGGAVYSTPIFTLAAAGAATFSSSVTAGSNSNASIVIRGNGLNNTTVSSTTLWADTAPLISVGNTSTTTNTAAGFQMQVGGGSALAGVLGIAESTSQASLGLFTGGSGTVSEKMRITSGGNVGIGTTSPNYLLHIAAGAANPQLQFTSTGTGSTTSDGFHIGVNNSTLNAFLLQKENASLQFLTNDTERMRLDASGNLGLGVTPSAWSLGTTLQIGSIYGTINYSGTSAILGIVNAFYNGSSYLRQNTGTAFSLEYNISVGNALAWRMGSDDSSGTTTSLTPVMALFNSGNLLIGSPPMSDNGARLQVSGNGHFSQADANVYIQSTSGIGKNWQLQSFSDGNFYINVSGVFSALNINGSTGAATFSSSVTASSFIRSGGTSSQYLMADGSVSTLTNPVTGSGTTNTIPKFTGTTTLGNSIITDTGSLVSIDGNFRIRNSNGFNDSVNFDRTRINGMILDSSGNLILNGSSGSSRLTCYGEGYFSDGIRTIAPTGGSSENWKLGNAVNGTVNANRLIRVEIAGVGYDLVARQII